jgi:hypothetical protein
MNFRTTDSKTIGFLQVSLSAVVIAFVVSLASHVSAQSTTAPGAITTYAGSGITYSCVWFNTPPNCPQIGAYGFSGDGGPATSAFTL